MIFFQTLKKGGGEIFVHASLANIFACMNGRRCNFFLTRNQIPPVLNGHSHSPAGGRESGTSCCVM